MKRNCSIIATVVLALACFAGCSKPWVVIQDLERPLASPSAVTVGDIMDELPLDMEDGKKPTAENIAHFKEQIVKELDKTELFSSNVDTAIAQYEITGSILDFKKGSGAVRFFIGFGLGNSRVTTSLYLLDARSKEVLFSGNFTSTVSSWAEKGDKVFDQTAKYFVKALKDRMKQLKKQQKT